MKEYSTESIRNVALVSHSSAGKTMMAETFLHYTGAITRLGKRVPLPVWVKSKTVQLSPTLMMKKSAERFHFTAL